VVDVAEHADDGRARGHERRIVFGRLFDFLDGLGTFATVGGDGLVSVWDHALKKRVSQLPGCGGPAAANSVASLAFSPDGTMLAVAASYAWEPGDPAQLPQYARPAPDAVKVVSILETKILTWTLLSYQQL
jgi:hypothetical protein